MLNRGTSRLIQSSGTFWEVYRNSVLVGTAKGYYAAKGEKIPAAYILFEPNTDILEGDLLKCDLIKKEFSIGQTELYTIQGALYGLKAFIKIAQDPQASPSQIFNVSTNYGSVGNITIDHQTLNFDFSTIESQIIAKGQDVDELQDLIGELRLIRESGTIKKGALARFSDVMERNSWITGSVLSALLGWLTR